MNELNINQIVKDRLKGKVLVNLGFADSEDSRSQYYGSIIKATYTGLDESREDPVVWLVFEDGETYAFLGETITVK